MADKRPDPRVTIELAEGDLLTPEEALGAADTLRQHGAPTLLQVAVGIARSKIGQREEGILRG